MQQHEQVKYKISINLIATRKYFVFVQPLIDSICKYFLLRHDIQINLFTDNIEREYKGDKRVKIGKHKIPSYGWPEATLYRYAVMTSIEYDCDYIVYTDTDMLIVSEIDESILGGLVSILHPGFSVLGGGSWCDDKNSNAYTHQNKRKYYACGGVQLGERKRFYDAMVVMAWCIADDEKRGVKAEHNDEQHWNKYISIAEDVKKLDSSYCMVEQPFLRSLWKIDKLEPKIIALEKNHNEIRS